MKNDFQLIRLNEGDTAEFKHEMQKAFQYGYELEFGPCSGMVLPETDIDRSLRTDGAIAYTARVNGCMEGGAIVQIDRKNRCSHLDLLFVKPGAQGKGLGQAIWYEIERLHSETEVWETCTPYFERRNIHFYVNCCGFHIVEFFNPRHRMPAPEGEYHGGMAEEAAQYFFRFLKVMKPHRAPVG